MVHDDDSVVGVLLVLIMWVKKPPSIRSLHRIPFSILPFLLLPPELVPPLLRTLPCHVHGESSDLVRIDVRVFVLAWSIYVSQDDSCCWLLKYVMLRYVMCYIDPLFFWSYLLFVFLCYEAYMQTPQVYHCLCFDPLFGALMNMRVWLLIGIVDLLLEILFGFEIYGSVASWSRKYIIASVVLPRFSSKFWLLI